MTLEWLFMRKDFSSDYSLLLFFSLNNILCLITDMADIVRAKFDFDVVGHYARPDVLSLTVRDQAFQAVTYTSELLSPYGRKDMIDM